MPNMMREPPLGRWRARAAFDFDVFVAAAALLVLLAAGAVAVDGACKTSQRRY